MNAGCVTGRLVPWILCLWVAGSCASRHPPSVPRGDGLRAVLQGVCAERRGENVTSRRSKFTGRRSRQVAAGARRVSPGVVGQNARCAVELKTVFRTPGQAASWTIFDSFERVVVRGKSPVTLLAARRVGARQVGRLEPGRLYYYLGESNNWIAVTSIRGIHGWAPRDALVALDMADGALGPTSCRVPFQRWREGGVRLVSWCEVSLGPKQPESRVRGILRTTRAGIALVQCLTCDRARGIVARLRGSEYGAAAQCGSNDNAVATIWRLGRVRVTEATGEPIPKRLGRVAMGLYEMSYGNRRVLVGNIGWPEEEKGKQGASMRAVELMGALRRWKPTGAIIAGDWPTLSRHGCTSFGSVAEFAWRLGQHGVETVPATNPCSRDWPGGREWTNLYLWWGDSGLTKQSYSEFGGTCRVRGYCWTSMTVEPYRAMDYQTTPGAWWGVCPQSVRLWSKGWQACHVPVKKTRDDSQRTRQR